MWAERLPCLLSTSSQAHLQGPQRLWREDYHQCSCCLITFFLSFLPLSISGCHSHLHSFPTPSFIYFSLFSCCFPFSTLIFPDLCQKKDLHGTEGEAIDTRNGIAHINSTFKSKQWAFVWSHHIFDHEFSSYYIFWHVCLLTTSLWTVGDLLPNPICQQRLYANVGHHAWHMQLVWRGHMTKKRALGGVRVLWKQN